MTKTNYAVAPGKYLEEWLEDQGMTQAEVAARLGCSRKFVNEIVNGHASITPTTANMLERVTGIKSESWLRIEATYRADLSRLAEQEALAAYAPEIPTQVASLLRKLGMMTATLRNPGEFVSQFLTFHGYGTWAAYLDSLESNHSGEYALAMLKDAKSSVDPHSLKTWIRLAERTEAYESGRNQAFNETKLRELLPDLKKRAAVSDGNLFRDLAALLARAGVIFIAIEPPAKLPVLGVTWWIDGKIPVIQQTGRWAKDGFAIWTFFHEIGHILNDPRGEMHLEYSTAKKRSSAAEKRANEFASNILFGPDGVAQFKNLRFDHEITQLSEKIGIAPGVAVVQMHRRRYLDYHLGNRLLNDLSGSFATTF